MEFEKKLSVTETGIPGLLVFDLPVHNDNRGWFKENWQREKMTALGLPDFGPVQNNISYNSDRGVTRGIHAEPWDKFISIAEGEIFGAWVDLRPGEHFGKVFTTKLDPSRAIFVPRGVGNSFQTLADNTAYTYLVNAHWSLDQKKSYTFVNLADPQLGIKWPIPLDEAELSDADAHHPYLAQATPMSPRRTMVIGAKGQLGQGVKAYAEQHDLQGFDYTDFDSLDIADDGIFTRCNWDMYGTIINAAAFTAVDKAETTEGRKQAWKTNVQGVANLARIATEHRLTLIHISTDYVFDGTEHEHTEKEDFAPLGVYGQTKAAADVIVSNVPKHYIFRSSWIVGEGHNFVARMIDLANKVAAGDAVEVQAPNDQVGRLTFVSDLTKGIFTLLNNQAEYGTYNLTGSGKISSWYDIACQIFNYLGVDSSTIVANSVDAYAKQVHGSPRPHYCGLALNKIREAGFEPADWETLLARYVDEHR